MDWMDYREKLGIGFSDQNKAIFFMTNMFNILEQDSGKMYTQIDDNEYFSFCNMTGTPLKMGDYLGSGYQKIINILRKNSESLEQFLAYYIAFINSQNERSGKLVSKADYTNLVCRMLQESHIPWELYKDNGKVFIFPKGAEELDIALVSQPLSWLSTYPVSRAAFVKALKQYSEVTAETASDVADLFRKALETFFQEFFASEKTLENCKGLYGGYLKGQNIPAEISANLETLLQAYTNFMNGHAKHHNKTSLNILEYIMYQTGNIIRLLITLKQEEKKQ